MKHHANRLNKDLGKAHGARDDLARIYQSGVHYDLMFASDSKDHSFWIEQARKRGRSILELACGTGRISIPLAEAGFDVTGIDLSESMLETARVKAIDARVKVAWIKGDMCHFHLNRSFSLIILAGNSFCHLHTLTDMESCLAAVRDHLLPDGRFIIDLFVPKIDLLLNAPGQRYPFSEYDDPDGRGLVTITHSFEYESDTQIKRIKTFHDVPGIDNEIKGELNMRMVFPQELDALLRYNGFTIVHKYGSNELAAFDKASEMQLVICKVS